MKELVKSSCKRQTHWACMEGNLVVSKGGSLTQGFVTNLVDIDFNWRFHPSFTMADNTQPHFRTMFLGLDGPGMLDFAQHQFN